MDSTSLKERRKSRKEKLKDTMESTFNETAETLATSDDGYPSDLDREEADNLEKDLKAKHKEKRRELARQFRSRSRENIHDELKPAKDRSRKKLEDSLRQTQPDEDKDVDETAGTPKKKSAAERKKARDKKRAGTASPDSTLPIDETPLSPEGMSQDMTGSMSEMKKKPRDRKALAEKMREKMKAKRAETADLEDEADDPEGTIPARKFRGQRDPNMSTRFEDTAAMEDELLLRRREREIKEMSWEELKKKAGYTEAQMFDFFTRDYAPEPEKSPEETAQPAAGDTATEVETQDDTKPLLESGLYKSSLDFVGVGRAEYIPLDPATMKELLYTPPVIEVEMSKKIEFAPRYKAEEGLYVGRPTLIAPRNRMRLENRLIKEGKLEWFGEDGEVDLLPDPLKEIPYRPLIWDDETNPMPEELKSDFQNPVPSEVAHKMLEPGITEHQYQIEVNLHSIVFTHHHLFTREHVLGHRLTHLFVQYEKSLGKDLYDYCEQRILALKRAVDHLLVQRQTFANLPNQESNLNELDERIRDYRLEIQKTRLARNAYERGIRSLQGQMFDTWKMIKSERQNNGYTNTKLTLRILKEPSNREDEENALREEVAETLAEERDLYETEYMKKLSVHQTKKRQFDVQQKEKNAARKRQQKREKTGVTEASAGENVRPDDELENDAASRRRRALVDKEQDDLRVLAEDDLDCPEQPVAFDPVETENRILGEIRECRRSPSDPILDVSLTESTPVTSDGGCPPAELKRREAMTKYSYYVKIFFNNKEVGTTDLRLMSSDFMIKFVKIYPIQIMQYPEVISLHLYERGRLSSTLLQEIFLDPPSPQAVVGRTPLDAHEFSTRQTMHHKGTSAVGSGVQTSLEAEDRPVVHLATEGKVFASAAWSVDEDGQPMAPPFSDRNNFSKTNRDEDAEEAERLAAEKDEFAKFDPNDPRNSGGLLNIQLTGEKGLQERDFFRLDHMQEAFNFATEDEMKMSNRFKLLQYRDKEIPEFKNMIVPATEREVSKEMFKEYEDRMKDKKKETMRGFEARRIQHQQHLDRIRDDVMQRFRQALHQKTLEEVVVEDEVPNIGAIIPTLLKKLTEVRRPLKPIREERKRVPAQNVSQMNIQLLVTISGAQNVPIRKDDLDKTVHPFIEVRFQNEKQVTNIADGANPSWNAELQIPFKPPPKMTTLDSVTDAILINLYDQLVIDESSDEYNVSQRIEKHWLASLEIPFTTVFTNSKVEGKFLMQTPPVLMGYQTNASESLGEHADRPLLSLFITLEPPVQPPQALKERFESTEDSAALNNAYNWLTRLQTEFPNRQRKVSVVDMKCNEVFITRFLAPIPPPDEILTLGTDLDSKKRMVARYVAMVPFLSDTVAFPGMCDIWSTSDEFLHMLSGDEEEHAVLLYNYFLHLYGDPAKVFLCLGNAIPEGPSAYVVTRDEEKVEFWNSVRGERFLATDVHCPLRSVGCFLNPHNVYANVQEKVEPWELRYDMEAPKDWRPLFSKDSRLRDLKTVQPQAIIYRSPDERDVEGLKFKMESQLRERFMIWRKGKITRWNYEFMKDLTDILVNLEKSDSKSTASMEGVLTKIKARYSMYGFPLNLPYMELDEIISRVEATGIHSTSAKNVEFALTVYVKAYANSVLSIWIYVASLAQRHR